MSTWKTNHRGTVHDLDLSGMRVTVHRWHGIADEWFGSCHSMGVERIQLKARELSDAKQEFFNYLHGRASNWARKLAPFITTQPTPSEPEESKS